MTKEEAIKKLQKQKAEYLDEWVDYSGIAEAFDMAIEALKTQEWIPVSKKPEPKEKTYLIQTDGGYVCSCRWTNVNHFWTDLTTDWHWHIMDVPQYSKVVAWMEKPELFEPESEE